MAVYQKNLDDHIHLDLNYAKQLAMTEASNTNYFDCLPQVWNK